MSHFSQTTRDHRPETGKEATAAIGLGDQIAKTDLHGQVTTGLLTGIDRVEGMITQGKTDVNSDEITDEITAERTDEIIGDMIHHIQRAATTGEMAAGIIITEGATPVMIVHETGLEGQIITGLLGHHQGNMPDTTTTTTTTTTVTNKQPVRDKMVSMGRITIMINHQHHLIIRIKVIKQQVIRITANIQHNNHQPITNKIMLSATMVHIVISVRQITSSGNTLTPSVLDVTQQVMCPATVLTL
jgi:hypothetical protein